MNGWLIYKIKESELDSSYYETNRFIEEAKKHDIQLKVYCPAEIEIIVTDDSNESIFINGKTEPLPDFVMPRMGSGTTYFALAVIRHLERLGIPCINSSNSIETVRDKLYAHQLLVNKHLPVPKTMLMKSPINSDLIHQQFKLPVVIKTLSGSLGKGVFLAENKKQFQDLTRMIEIANPSINIILQEMIETSRGRDLRVFVVGGRIIGCMERCAADGDFRANFSAGGSVNPYELTPEIEWLAIEATKILGLDISGVDLLFDEKGYKICEVNSSPMFKGLESCLDINVPEEIFNYIKVRINGY